MRTPIAFQDEPYCKGNVCWVCGNENAHGLYIKSYWKGDEAVCTWKAEDFRTAGWPHVLNGGIISGIIDCHCVQTAMAAAHKDNRAEEREHTYFLSKRIQDLSIPSTIQDVIMARVDALPEGAREVLQTASVIEREFSYQLLKMITGLAETELIHHLSSLKDTELIYEGGIYPESSFIFKHALTREPVKILSKPLISSKNAGLTVG
jgi:hypothetical protein